MNTELEGCIYGHRILKRDGKVYSEGGGERMSKWMYDCIVIGWVYRSFDVWMNREMDAWMDGSMDG